MDPLNATIEEFAADGYTHVEANCPRCRVIRLRTITELPKISMGLPLHQLARRLRCAELRRDAAVGEAVATDRCERKSLGAQVNSFGLLFTR
jgi:hypothetical protein